jgi:aldehyde dehydrogenase (NAD+)
MSVQTTTQGSTDTKTGKPTRRPMPRGQLLIDGQWRDSSDGATAWNYDPTTEEQINQIAQATASDVDAAVHAASTAFHGPWRKMQHEQRARILFRMADLLEERAEEFGLRETMDMGLPYHDFLKVVMPHCAGLLRFFAGLAMQISGGYRDSYEPDIRILTRRAPLGVVACVTPFNMPLTLSLSKIAPALAAGNTIVHKPASDTPLTALLLAQTALDAGIPTGVYNLVTGPGSTIGEILSKHPLVEKIAFTGSTSVGQRIIQNGASTLKHMTMELGGKSPNIVFADANVDAAVETAFWAIFFNKGEVCVAGSRLLVERPIYDEVVDKLAKKARDAVLGDPLDAATAIGPIASRAEFDKVMSYIQAGKDSAAKLVAGGLSRKVNGKGLFIEPTVFANATNDMKISREEIFGPVLPVIPFEGEEEAVRLANDTPYGLASGIQTANLGRALRLADRIDAGTVWINTWHRYHPNAPFGGYKLSGYGREQGVEALESYMQYKTVWVNVGG